MDEGSGFENQRTPEVPWVRIPPLPPSPIDILGENSQEENYRLNEANRGVGERWFDSGLCYKRRVSPKLWKPSLALHGVYPCGAFSCTVGPWTLNFAPIDSSAARAPHRLGV